MWRLFLVVSLLMTALTAQALTLKVGVLAPDSTNWAQGLKQMVKEIKTATDSRVNIKVYFGGAQGDEPDVLRKIRIGQLHGGIFTGKTLGDINGDVRVLELPFTFYDDEAKASRAISAMAPTFDAKFGAAGFHNLGFFEVGKVYFVSQKQTANLESLKGLKIWSWEGDPLVQAMIESLNLISVPLPLPDVLSSLSTGIVEAAYAPPMGILALQWNSKVKYLVDFPLSFSVGAFLIDDKSWAKVSAADKKKVSEISSRAIKEINKNNSKDNADSLALMKASGIEFLNFPASDLEQGKELRVKIIQKLQGPLFSKEVLTRLEGLVKQ